MCVAIESGDSRPPSPQATSNELYFPQNASRNCTRTQFSKAPRIQPPDAPRSEHFHFQGSAPRDGMGMEDSGSCECTRTEFPLRRGGTTNPEQQCKPDHTRLPPSRLDNRARSSLHACYIVLAGDGTRSKLPCTVWSDAEHKLLRYLSVDCICHTRTVRNYTKK